MCQIASYFFRPIKGDMGHMWPPLYTFETPGLHGLITEHACFMIMICCIHSLLLISRENCHYTINKSLYTMWPVC